jgi:uncharacterized protein YegJ (DUF2314 family)
MFEHGDYVKAEFKDDATGQSEWMWVRVDHADDGSRIIFGMLDNEPVTVSGLRLGMELAVSYDNVREHMKAGSLNQ